MKQPPEVFYKKNGALENFEKINRKTHVPEHHFEYSYRPHTLFAEHLRATASESNEICTKQTCKLVIVYTDEDDSQ